MVGFSHRSGDAPSPFDAHPHLLSAGVGRQGGQSMLAAMDAGGGTITVESPLPAMPGSTLDVAVSWPGVPGGDARIELHRRSNAPNGINAVIASAPTTGAELASGAARASLPLGPDLSPSFDGADLQLFYMLRVLVDRRFMPDTAIERPVAIA